LAFNFCIHNSSNLSLFLAIWILDMPRYSISLRHILIFHSHLFLGLPRALFPPHQIPYVFLSSFSHLSRAPSISFSLIWSPEKYLMRSKDHIALYYEKKPEEKWDKPWKTTVEFWTWHILNTNQKLCLLTQFALCSKFQCNLDKCYSDCI